MAWGKQFESQGVYCAVMRTARPIFNARASWSLVSRGTHGFMPATPPSQGPNFLKEILKIIILAVPKMNHKGKDQSLMNSG